MRSVSKKVIFVQGYGDYSDGKWPGWLERESVKNGFQFINVKVPEPMFPVVEDWVQALKNLQIIVTESTYFVGHSLGCITIARFLETLPKGERAGGCVFVAGFCDFPHLPLISDFCTLPLDWKKVKENAGEVFAILSADDHLVPLDLSKDFANKCGAQILMENGKGHFKEDVEEIPSLLNAILEMDLEVQKRREMKRLVKEL